MACFLVPAGEAAVTTLVHKVIKAKEEKNMVVSDSLNHTPSEDGRTPLSRKLKWLNTMLWGGSALLAFEHLWHGELTPWFPFLSATKNATDTAEMLHEMSTVGTAMAVLITGVWIGMTAISAIIEKRPEQHADSGELS